MLRKSISILLALVMIVSIFTIIPTSASAEDDSQETTSSKETTSYEANVEFVKEEPVSQGEDYEEASKFDNEEEALNHQDDNEIVATGATADYSYNVNNDGTVCITKYIGTSNNVNIPGEIDGHTVTEIGNDSFKETTIISVSIPNTVTIIGNYAFQKCFSLKEIALPKSITTAGEGAFNNCTGLTEVFIPKSLTNAQRMFWGCKNLAKMTFESGTVRIPDNIADNCTGLQEAILPDSVTTIGTSAFSECNSLSMIVLPYGLLTINSYAFHNCYSLKEIALPKSITTAGEGAFNNCTGLTEVFIPKSLTNAQRMFWGCKNLAKMTFESGTVRIPDNIADNCTGLQEAILPDSVTTIGTSAFSECNSLSMIVLPYGLLTINSYAFHNCYSLKEIALPKSITTAGEGAFNNCTGLTEVFIPKSLTNAQRMFLGCKNLAKMTFESGTVKIPDNIADNCTGLQEAILPDSVTTIGTSAFSGCNSLSRIVLPYGLQSINSYAFHYCYSLKEIALPKSITTAGEGAFNNCTGLTEVFIPKSLTNAQRMFLGCKNLAKMTFESGTVKIPDNIGDNCTGLQEAILPDSVTTIGTSAFSGCNSLSRIVLPYGLQSINNYAFYNCSKELVGYCPKYTKSTVCCIDNKLNVVSNYDNRLEEPKALESKDSKFYFSSSSNVTVNCAYTIKDSIYTKASNYSVKIYIPDGASVAEGSLYLDKKLCTSFKDENNSITIPVTSKSGKLSFNLEIEDDCKLRTYAVLNYRMDGKNDYDIIDVINEDVQLVTLSADDVVSKNTIAVSGVAPAGKDVALYINDKKVTTVKANKASLYSTTLTLPNVEDDKNYVIKAETKDKNDETIFAQRSVRYVVNAPELLSFTMDYNGKTYDLASGEKQSIVFRLESFHGVTPFRFEAKYANREKIDAVYFTSTRNQVTKQMKATYNEATGSYVAKGFFDEKNHDYVPGKINVQYSLKRERDHFDLETIDEEMNEPLSDVLKDATCEISSNTDVYKEIVINLENGERITYKYEKLDYESFDEQYPDNNEEIASTGGNGEEELQKDSVKILKKILKKGWKFYKEGNKTYYYQVDGEEKSTTYWDFEQEKDYLIKESIEYPKKYFIENALTVFGGEELAPISKGAGYCIYNSGKEYINYFGTAMDYNMAIAQIMASDIPEASKRDQIAYIQGLKMAAMDVAAAKMVGSYLKFASGVVMGECPPLGIALYVAGYAMADMWAKDPDIFDKLHHKWNSINAFMMDFIIDPSGYIFSGVTSNRIDGAKVTAYWIPYDENDEDFWENPDESKAEIWDASEYSQINPLFTDNDGNYAWDVPEGLWKVVVEKEGYETYSTGWLPVPPPQTDVNINLISTATPELESAVYADGAITLTFSQYMDPATMKNIVVKDYRGAEVSYTLSYSENEKDADGTIFAKEYRLVFDESYEAKYDYYAAEISEAESYSGVKMGERTEIGEKPVIKLGDVDGDGDVTIADATVIQRYVIKIDTIAFDEIVADIDGDGVVTIVDATFIQRYCTNAEVPYKIGEGIF